MKYTVVVDSASDIPAEIASKLGIVVVPMPVYIEGEEYHEGVDIFPEQFYKDFPNYSELPKTSQPNPKDLLATYEEILAEGREVVAVHLSSGLSSTYQTACMVKEMCSAPEKVHVFDSLGASFGFGLLAILINDTVNEYDNWKDIETKILSVRDSIRYIFTIDTLEYLVKGGRVSKTAGFVGGLLDVKPILHITKEGKIEVYNKVRSRKSAIRKLIELLEEEIDRSFEQIISISHSASREDALFLAEEIKARVPVKDILINDIGCVIGSHVGPGTIALFYQKNKAAE